MFKSAWNVTPRISNLNPRIDVETNIGGSINLLDSAVRHKVKRFVFISSGGTVYGNALKMPIPEDHPTFPNCSYGITKLAIENYLRIYHSEMGLPSCSLRLSNPYGEFQRVKSNQGVIPVFCYKILKGENIDIWGDGNVVRDFVYIGDVMSAIASALLKNDIVGEINIGSGIGTSINQLITIIENVVGKKAQCVFHPKRRFDVPVNVLDINKASLLLQWRPQVKLEKGIRYSIDWVKKIM